MFVRIGADGAASLEEAEDLRRLSIRMSDTPRARAALAGLGRPDGSTHAWIAPERLRALARGVPPGWEGELAAMVSFAGTRGWTDASGALRAHVETI